MTHTRKLLAEALEQCTRLARHLQWSLPRVASVFPLDGNAINALSPEEMERLDAFCMRFGKLQDMLGRQLFRGLLTVEQEEAVSMLDCLHAMEKRRLIDNSEQWIETRLLRNRLAHDYPLNDQDRAQALNSIYDYAPILVTVLESVRNYIADKKLL